MRALSLLVLTIDFLQNAISFAINGNIALSMEIGSAYALQVLLLQIPALVLYSAFVEGFYLPEQLSEHVFPYVEFRDPVEENNLLTNLP